MHCFIRRELVVSFDWLKENHVFENIDKLFALWLWKVFCVPLSALFERKKQTKWVKKEFAIVLISIRYKCVFIYLQQLKIWDVNKAVIFFNRIWWFFKFCSKNNFISKMRRFEFQWNCKSLYHNKRIDTTNECVYLLWFSKLIRLYFWSSMPIE